MSENTKHTPGPWGVHIDGAADAGPDNAFQPIGGCGCCGSPWANGEGQDERDANVRLIAAAPDLLAALIRISTFDEYEPAGPAARTAKSAIAKALGTTE